MFPLLHRPLLLLEKESFVFGPTTRKLYRAPVCSVGDRNGSTPTQQQDSGALKGREAGIYRERDVNNVTETSKRTGVWERYRSKYDQNAMNGSNEKRKAFEAWNNEQIKDGKQHLQESTAEKDSQSQPPSSFPTKQSEQSSFQAWEKEELERKHNAWTKSFEDNTERNSQKGPWNKVRMAKPSKLPAGHLAMWEKKFVEAAKRKQMKISKMQKTVFNKKKRDHMEKLKKFLAVQHQNKAKEFEHRLKRKAHIENMRQQETAKIIAEIQKCRGHDK